MIVQKFLTVPFPNNFGTSPIKPPLYLKFEVKMNITINRFPVMFISLQNG